MRSFHRLKELQDTHLGGGVSDKALRLNPKGRGIESRPVHFLNFENNVSVSYDSTQIMFQISFLHTKLANQVQHY